MPTYDAYLRGKNYESPFPKRQIEIDEEQYPVVDLERNLPCQVRHGMKVNRRILEEEEEEWTPPKTRKTLRWNKLKTPRDKEEDWEE